MDIPLAHISTTGSMANRFRSGATRRMLAIALALVAVALAL